MVLPIYDGLPTRRRPYVNYGLMILCIAIWGIQQLLGHVEVDAVRYGFVPFFLFQAVPAAYDVGAVPAPVSLVTYAFLHGDIWHLGGNMLFLWIFGNNVEDALGSPLYLAFYLFGAAAAALGEGLLAPESLAPVIGASGAISGVLGAYLMLYPRQRVVVLISFFPLPLPAFIVIGLWFVMQLAEGFSGAAAADNIAWVAHVGGFIAGAVAIRPFRHRLRPRRGPWG